MKAPFVVAVALIVLTSAGVAHAGPGPTSPLYLTAGGARDIMVVQGNVVNFFPQAYGSPTFPFEAPIAVSGDVRTTGVGNYFGLLGGQYTLSGTPTGMAYTLPGIVSFAYDSTTDGVHNYLVDFQSGTVYQTARDFTNPIVLFDASPDSVGIAYDATNHSLWVSSGGTSTVVNYSLSGALLSSFSTGHTGNYALALDPADQTLWLVNDYSTYNLEQYSKSGVLLSTGPYLFYAAWGAEFNFVPTPAPEPGSLILFGSGILGLAGVLRRKINL